MKEDATIIIIPITISKILTMLNPIKKIIPLAIKIKPRNKTKPEGRILKIPKSQKQTAMKISKTPNILTNIIFL